VADFGLAVREEDLPTQRGHRAGTLPYMSPEQVRREGHLLDGRTDIYSLGVVLYELLCGRRPFEAPTDDGLIDQILNREAKPPRQIRNSIPRELESVCLKALSKRIHDRYSTAKDMAEEALQVAEAFKKPKNESALEDNLEEIGRRMASADERELRRLLRLLPEIGDAACVPLVFRHLVHPSEPVRDQARKVVHALGWKKVSAAIEDLANCGGAVDMGVVLDGLAAFEAHAQIVELLDRLVVIVKDDLRNRTILLLERKRLGLELNAVAALFREIHSPYRIVKALGQGLFAAAYLARVDGTDLEVVVRVLRPEFAGQPHVRVQFLDLSKKALRVVHENLALTREARAFPDRNIYFAVRDYVNGVTLQKLLEGGKRFERVQIVRLLRQLLLALGAVHRNGMWHGGVKPSNVFVCGEDRVVLGDPSLPVQCIGVALDRLAYDYRYFAPENFSAGAAPGPHADFYSLGCVAYELACGQPPFVSDNYLALAARHLHEAVPPPSTRHSRLGPEADQLILKLLARSPADRYTRSEDIGLALDWLEALWLTSGPLAHTPTRPLLDDASLARFEDAQSIFQFGASPSRIESGAVHESDDADESGEETRSGNADDLGDEDFVPRESAQVMPTRVGLYEILELVGRGGMGVVYKARHVELDRVVALKTLVRGRHTERNQVARFQKEARAAARLQHPNIVQIYDIIEHEGFTYLALEYVGGGSLSKQPPAESPKQVFAVVETVAKLAHAVQHAHEQGIVHRDLKPSNILLTEDGQPKIADFGLAKLLEPSASELESTALGTIMGTPAYMAPEQAAGNIGEIGPTTDIYGLGAILYALLTGRPPFKGQSLMETLNQLATQQPEPPRTLNPSVDQSLNLICLKCLEKDPRKRYESAKKLAEDLERWLQGGPTSTSPETTFRRLLAWVRRSLDGLYPFRKRARRPIT
jgi:serine/threonine protein kinase